MPADQVLESLQKQVDTMIGKYMEAQGDLWDNYVDPREAYLGPDGEVWLAIGAGAAGDWYGLDLPPYRTEQELLAMRAIGRLLWRDNEFAQNGHENRVSYIIGWGHTYNVDGRTGDVPEAVTQKVKDVLDEWLKVNKWPTRQQEMLMRADRDGEVFLRTFESDDGLLRVRFIEPGVVGNITNPKPNESFGIRTEEDDIETVLSYWDGTQWVDASEIQHRKYNVDSGLKRGIPLFWSVRKNLARATKLLRNMSIATEIQTAIALIRKHEQATAGAVRTFIKGTAVATDANGRSVLSYPPGSILDTPKGTDYTMPGQGIDPSKTVAALQAELRAVAARLVMPEFMLTSDASNANFASTMVAEGPAVKKFERDQQTQIMYDLELIQQAMEYAVDSGLISQKELDQCEIKAIPPSVKSRDELKEAQVRQIDMGLGILSKQTATAETGREYDQEQDNIEQDMERTGGIPGVGVNPPLPPVPIPGGNFASA